MAERTTVDFWLGTHMPGWLAKTDVPLFVSDVRLRARRGLPRARGPWALDSGGFSEISLHGAWTQTPRDYAARVARYTAEIGSLAWAAVQDWMCEPAMLARTGLDVLEHQRRTVASYLRLRDLDSELPWVPVLQGWTEADYLRHMDAYGRAGVALDRLPLVGLGSVCRRQATDEVEGLIRGLHGLRLKLHGFGFKLQGLARVWPYLASSDSMAWSYAARRDPPLPGCSGHTNCANCLRYALQWRGRVLSQAMTAPVQLHFGVAA